MLSIVWSCITGYTPPGLTRVTSQKDHLQFLADGLAQKQLE